MAEAGSHADVGLFVDHGPDAQRSAVFEVLVDAAVLAANGSSPQPLDLLGGDDGNHPEATSRSARSS
jgi:hypothetical protein